MTLAGGRCGGGPGDHPGAVGAARGYPGRQQHVSCPAGPAPAPGRPDHGAPFSRSSMSPGCVGC